MNKPVLDYHPEYGFTDEIRLRAVFDAKTMKVKAAAEINRVSVASIYKWRAAIIKKAKEDWG
jgi:transposase